MRPIDGDVLYDLVEGRYKFSSGIEHRYERDLLDLICSMPTITPPNEPITLEQLRASPHGKIKDSTLQSICNRANEIACRPPEGKED